MIHGFASIIFGHFVICITDNSSFSESPTGYEAGFHLFNQFAVFVYSQLQSILPDSVLGSVSDWDSYLKLDLTQPGLPFKSCDEFVLNSDFHELVTSSKLPRPSKFIEQSIAFYKAFCRILLQHKIATSDLIGGLSSFDSVMMLDGEEKNYLPAIEMLTSYFSSHGRITVSDKTKAVSQYRSLVTKFRSGQVCRPDDWFEFLCSCYELHCRPELHRVFKYSCLCLPPKAKITSQFVVPMPELGPDEEVFHSCISSIQLAYKTVPNVSSLFRDPRSLSRVFRLIGRGRDLLEDRKFSVWNFLKGSGPRRVRFQTKLESAYKSAVVRREEDPFSVDPDVSVLSRVSKTTSSPDSQPVLGKATMSLSRCADGGNDSARKAKGASGKAKKN